MENKFKEVMANRSDSELLEIITKLKNDYQPEAVEAAETELKKRNLSSEQIESANEKIHEKEIIIQEKESEPLGWIQKIMFFVFFWGVIPWAIAGTFKSNGYIGKYKNAWKFMKYGFLTFMVVNCILFLTIYLSFK